MEATSRAGLTGVKTLARQYKLLMWKNLLLLSRSPVRIAVEIIWPLVLFLILAAVRSRETLVQWNPECHFHNKPMPSAGMLPFFQGMMCLSNNTCFDHEVADELSGRLTSFETTGVERLVNDTATFLSNDTQTQVLYNAVTEMAKISDALQTLQSNRNSLGSLLALDEPSFYQKLEDSGVPLTNRTADLLFNNVTLNSSALLDELGRIQDRNPAFIPLLETFLVDLVTLQTLLTNDSQLWAKALTEDFVESLASVPNIDLSPDSVLDRVAADGINFGNIDMTDLLGKIQGASSPEDLQNIIANATSAAGIGEQVMNVVALSASQRQALDEFCDEDQNKNSSACLLGQILSDNSTNAAAAVRELCSQSRYDGLVTCTLFDFTNVSNVIEASAVVENLCEHHIISNTSLCAMAEVQQHLLKILENASSSEVLCNADSTVLIYDSPEIESEVETPMCNLNDTQQKLLLDILVEHINTTALREVYFPDGFDPEVLLELAKQLQQLRDMPSVQDMIADVQDIMAKGFGISFCGSAADVPLMSPLAALSEADDGTFTFNDDTNDTSASGTATPSLEDLEEEIQDDTITEVEYQNVDNPEWRHYQHCKRLFRNLTHADEEMGSYIYQQLEPILLGKIPYSPATAEINETIRRANETFIALATIKQAANDIRQNYRDWEVRLNSFGENLKLLEKLLDLIIQVDPGNTTGLPELVTPQQFIDTMLSLGFPMENAQLPSNFTEALMQLRQLSVSLEVGGSIWNTVDQLGRAMSILYTYLDCVELDKFEAYDSEYDLESRSVELISYGKFWAAVVFDDSLVQQSELPSHVSYKLRMNTDKVDGTDRIEDKYWNPRPRARPPFDTKYITYGFAYLQDMIEHSLIAVMAGTEEKVGVYLQQFPYPCYTSDYFVRGMSTTLPLFMVISWIFSVALLVKSIVYEKQERLKEQMKIMGLANGTHWCAWYTVSFMLMAPSIVLLCIIFKYAKVLQAADPSVMALWLYAFSFSTTSMAFMFSVFFTKANLAACCGAIMYFTLYLPYAVVYQYEEDMDGWMKSFSCLLSPVAFGIGTSYVARYEEQGVGIQWSNISKSPLPADNYNLLKCVGMLFLDGILYFLIAWYKEHVFPGKYGTPKPFYFLFTKSFWCGTTPAPYYDIPLTSRNGCHDVNQSGNGTCTNNQSPDCEAEPSHLNLGIQLRGLTKVYSSGNKLAVDGLSLNMYEDQITSFLGHNGAGKTTTMSILCGLFTPTDGTAIVYGKDIRHELDDIRKSMGFCPQFNVLYDSLTVAEHILFYGQLKGYSQEAAEKEMMSMLEATGMLKKKHAKASSLSGGMKRKLSVMCAFVGGSKCVVLDEPTAGVDPYSRRQIWELLLKFKKNRTILLSTHHMDEADFLGDRIAIISHGKLCCVGSSLYLKALHGSGYYLTLVQEEETSAAQSLEEEIERFVTSRVPGAILTESVGQELVFKLPSKEVQTGAFTKFFEDLDTHLARLKLTSYGICDTTLEEVFLNVAEATGVDTEELLTDGGTLAMPARRNSLKLTKGARRAFGKLKEKLSKLKKPSNKYSRQLDDDTTSTRGFGLNSIPETDPELENANNVQRTGSDTAATDGDDTEDCLSDDDEQSNVASAGHLSIAYSSNSAQISSNAAGFSGDGESKANKLVGWKLVLHQMKGLIIKRFHHVRRDKKAFICEIILPAAFILAAMAFALAVPPIRPQPPLELQPWMYEPARGDKHLNFFYRNEYPSSEFTQNLEKLVTESQYGTRCMNPDVYEIDGLPCGAMNSPLDWSEQPSDISPQCDCHATGYQQCGDITNMPSNVTLANHDYLLNLTNQNVSEWLVKTMQPYIKRRYGGFSFDVGGSAAYVNESHIEAILEAAMPDSSNVQTAVDIAESMEDILDMVNIHENVKVWFNNKGWTASVSYMNAANNLLLRYQLNKTGRSTKYRDFGITAINHPMNRTDYQFQQELQSQSYITLLVSLCVIFAMSLIPATFVLYLIMDRVSTSKSLQYVSGMNRMVYWCTNFLWDMFNYAVCASLCFIIFLMFNEKAFVSATNGPCLAALLLLYGWAMIPFMYPFSYIFSEPAMAYVVLACMNIFLGFITTLSTFILESYPQDEELTQISNQLKKAFLIFPHYCLGRGIMDISVEHIKKEIAEILSTTYEYDPFALEVTGKNLLALFGLGCFFFFLLIMFEYKFFYHRKRSSKLLNGLRELEDDVLAEERAVNEGSRSGDALQTKKLSKRFQGNTAVNGLTFGVPSGQCFGLLGVNGAGKTTTFRMLTGITGVSGGDAFIHGHSITHDPTKVQQLIGYCPQFSALDPLLTVTEHLEYYARLRGVASQYVKSVAAAKLRKLGLVKYQKKKAGLLSGGNKRKLQAAIALIGNPPIIFMDEPTTGMDPKARRFLWDSILKISRDGHAVVLTSHSMEECEVLCSRLAIMVNGSFKCLGTPQHLKNKYGDGYHVTIRISRDANADIDLLLRAFSTEFASSATLLESSLLMAQFHLSSNIRIAEIFSGIESFRVRCAVEDYSVTQTSLDHVFIRFAKEQADTIDAIEAALDSINGSSVSGNSQIRIMV